jgi:hypothetical protein
MNKLTAMLANGALATLFFAGTTQAQPFKCGSDLKTYEVRSLGHPRWDSHRPFGRIFRRSPTVPCLCLLRR